MANQRKEKHLGVENPDDGNDLRWKQLTAHGNDAFAGGNHEEATNLYNAALKEARRLFHLALRGAEIESVPILVISYHNAAENERTLGRESKALELYSLAFEEIVGTAESLSAPTALRATCVRNLSHALSPLVLLMRETGAEAQVIASLVKRARRVALAADIEAQDTPAPQTTRH